MASAATYRLIMAGNRGVGKSTLLNSLIGEVCFRSGALKVPGFIEHADVENGVIYTMAPRLDDVREREQAAANISKVLSSGGNIKLFFILTLRAGSVRQVDLATMHEILDAVAQAGVRVEHKFSIVVNKVTEGVRGWINSWYGKELFAKQLQIKYRTTHVILLRFDVEAHDSMDYLMGGTEKFRELENFIERSPHITIGAGSSVEVRVNKYEETMRIVAEMMDKVENIHGAYHENTLLSRGKAQEYTSQFYGGKGTTPTMTTEVAKSEGRESCQGEGAINNMGWSKKRFDIFLSFYGADELTFKGSDKGETYKKRVGFLMNLVRSYLKKYAWRDQNEVGKLSVFFCDKSVEQPLGKRVMQGILQTRGGGIFLCVITQNFFTSEWCIAELAEAAEFQGDHDDENLVVLLVCLNLEIDFVRKALRENEFFKSRGIGYFRMWQLCSESEQVGILAKQIAEISVKRFLTTRCHVAGEEIEESYSYLKLTIGKRYRDATCMAEFLRLKGQAHYTTGLEVLRVADARDVISPWNVDNLLVLDDDNLTKYVNSYKRKWLGEWTYASWNELLDAAMKRLEKARASLTGAGAQA